MKFSLLAVTAIHLGKYASASPVEDSAEEHEINGWWEDDVQVGLKERSVNAGKTFTLTQVKNGNYKGPGAPFDLLKAYAKYHSSPPKSLQEAIKTNSKIVGAQKGSATALASSYFDSEYVVPVTIGTPGQLTYLNLDTGSADLWTFSTDTYQPAQKGHILYKPKKSKTSRLLPDERWSIEYGDGSGANGIVYKDKVRIGNTHVKSQAVESAMSVSSAMREDTFSHGIMGMAFSSINSVLPTRQKTYFQNVHRALAAPIFTANLQKQKAGTYNFGYIDKDEYKGSIYYQKSISEAFWQVKLTGYKIGSNSFKHHSWSAIVDTGTTLLLAPQNIVTAYYKKVKGAKFNKNWGVMIFPCASKLPNFVFGIGPYRGTVPGNYLNYGAMGDGNCYGGLQASNGLPFAILGDILLKAQFVVFDLGNQTVGFANKQTLSS